MDTATFSEPSAAVGSAANKRAMYCYAACCFVSFCIGFSNDWLELFQQPVMPSVAADETPPQAVDTDATDVKTMLVAPETVPETLEQRADRGDVEALTVLIEPLLKEDADFSAHPDAVKWLTKAAEAGIREAQFDLGCRLYYGAGVEEDEVAAVTWLIRAADQGHAAAATLVGLCFLRGNGVETDPSVAVAWLEKGLQNGDSWAAMWLAVCRENGLGLEKDQAAAFRLFRQAAEAGVPPAQAELGRCYTAGMGTEKNPHQAFRWTKAAAKEGHEGARLAIAAFYQLGFGTKRDQREAARLYLDLADEGNAEAQIAYAVCLLTGEGVARDMAEASRWAKKSAMQGNSRAQTVLAAMYARGDGVTRNLVLAYALACIAAAQDDDEAAKLRDQLESRMTREQIADAQGMALRFKPESSDSDEGDSENTSSGQRRCSGSGSGFFVTAAGHFVTNYHVIANARRITIKTPAGVFPATVVRVDTVNDIAVLKVSGTFSALPVRGSGRLKLADRVATVGYPNPSLQGVAAKYSAGEVAALTGVNDDPRYLQISVPVQPGNSGGPLVDNAGYVVGVVAARLDKARATKNISDIPENVNYAVKGSILLNLLESIPEVGSGLTMSPARTAMSDIDVASTAEAASGMVIVEF